VRKHGGNKYSNNDSISTMLS